MAFTRMDAGSADDWSALERAVASWQSALPARIQILLTQLAKQSEGMAIDQLQHSLQTASRAARAGASREVVVAALCHDIGTVISYENHGAIAAEILRPYVAADICEIVRTHQDFQKAHYGDGFGRSAAARERYARKPWYEAARTFSDEWDQTSFDPRYKSFPLEYFLPLLEETFTTPYPARSDTRRAAFRPRLGRWIARKFAARRKGVDKLGRKGRESGREK